MNTTEKLHPIFAVCTENAIGGMDLLEPFVHDGFVYSSDSCILVRTSDTGVVSLTLTNTKLSESRLHAVDEIRPVIATVPIPDVAQFITCPNCEGKKLVKLGRCDNCGDYCGPFLRDGKPVEFDCPECEGTGLMRNLDPVQLADDPPAYANAYYLGLLRKHGVLLIDICSRSPDVPLQFTGDGFVGWLMPIEQTRARRLLSVAERSKASP